MDTAGALKEIAASLGFAFHLQGRSTRPTAPAAPAFAGRACSAAWRFGPGQRELNVPLLADVMKPPIWPKCARWWTCCKPPPSCPPTDFIRAVAQTGLPVTSRGGFWRRTTSRNVIDKARAAGPEEGLPEDDFMAWTRVRAFATTTSVDDMRGLAVLREPAPPWCLTPRTRCSCLAARGTPFGRRPAMVPWLARLVAVGVAGLFMERPTPTRPTP